MLVALVTDRVPNIQRTPKLNNSKTLDLTNLYKLLNQHLHIMKQQVAALGTTTFFFRSLLLRTN